MIELLKDNLTFSFPELHRDAKLTVSFQRTLRIPDDGRTYPLPPGLGSFPLRHVDDFGQRVPRDWVRHGGVMLPMYQSEAMWINFSSAHVDQRGQYPFAVKIATGKINAVSGEAWRNGLSRDPQDYVVSPNQPWLDGYNVKQGVIRQFVAMPLGEGYTAEEQLTGQAQHGGLQLIVYPMKPSAFERHFPRYESRWGSSPGRDTCLCLGEAKSADMGLAPGGEMRQEIYDDPYQPNDWCHDVSSRCFVHICNSQRWYNVTGTAPPPTPVTAKRYTQAGLPWFEYYGDPAATLKGAEKLQWLKSVADMKKSEQQELEDNESIGPEKIVVCQPSRNQVREGKF